MAPDCTSVRLLSHHSFLSYYSDSHGQSCTHSQKCISRWSAAVSILVIVVLSLIVLACGHFTSIGGVALMINAVPTMPSVTGSNLRRTQGQGIGRPVLRNAISSKPIGQGMPRAYSNDRDPEASHVELQQDLTSDSTQESAQDIKDSNGSSYRPFAATVAMMSVFAIGTGMYSASKSRTGGFGNQNPTQKAALRTSAGLKPRSILNLSDMSSYDEGEKTESLAILYGFLKSVDNAGSCSIYCGGPANHLPSAVGLSIEGIGDMPLPLSDEHARAIASMAEQAPHGQGMETVVDTAVRNTLQINPDKVTLKNPQWAAGLSQLVSHAASALGVDPRFVRAEMYKLLYYEKGGFFKKHRDTEKAPGMFATLVVQLPSEFHGGEYIVTHGGKTAIFPMDGLGTPFGCRYVAHYADCEHEIGEIESGRRLALIYSLCYTGDANPPTASSQLHDFHYTMDLSEIVRKLPPSESMFILPLEHQYTQVSLSSMGAQALKGTDRMRQRALEIAGKGKWQMIIVEFRQIVTEHGFGEGDYFESEWVGEGEPETMKAFKMDGSDGSGILKRVNMCVNLIPVQRGGMLLASESEASDMWFQSHKGEAEYTGNEGAARDTTYNVYGLIVYHPGYVFDVLANTDVTRISKSDWISDLDI